jgi:hypothetical protein
MPALSRRIRRLAEARQSGRAILKGQLSPARIPPPAIAMALKRGSLHFLSFVPFLFQSVQ